MKFNGAGASLGAASVLSALCILVLGINGSVLIVLAAPISAFLCYQKFSRLEAGRKRTVMTCLIAASALPVGLLTAGVSLAIREEISFAMNKTEMQNLARRKHLNNLLALPTEGSDQESSVEQIKEFKQGRWNRFISDTERVALSNKVDSLEKGIETREAQKEFMSRFTGAMALLRTELTSARQDQLWAQRLSQVFSAEVTSYTIDYPPVTRIDTGTFNEEVVVFPWAYANADYRFECPVHGGDLISSGYPGLERGKRCQVISDGRRPISASITNTEDGFVLFRAKFHYNEGYSANSTTADVCRDLVAKHTQLSQDLSNAGFAWEHGTRQLFNLKTDISSFCS